MKILHYVMGVICAICIFVVTMWTSIEMMAYDSDFYMEQYEINNVFELIQISHEDLYAVTVQMIDYMRLRTNDLNLNVVIDGEYRPFFNQRELDHMVDVQNLFRIFRWARNISVIILLLLFILYKTGIAEKWTTVDKKSTSIKMMLNSTCISLGLIVFLLSAMGLGIVLDFDRSFIIFHEIFFFNDLERLWILNPNTDLLINIVPLNFFINITIRTAMYFYMFITVIMWSILFFGGIIPRRL